MENFGFIQIGNSASNKSLPTTLQTKTFGFDFRISDLLASPSPYIYAGVVRSLKRSFYPGEDTNLCLSPLNSVVFTELDVYLLHKSRISRIQL